MTGITFGSLAPLIVSKWGSFENFFNDSDIEEEKDFLDPGMYEICKFFESNEFPTNFSCNGHNKRSAYILFKTTVNHEQLEEFCKTLPFKVKVFRKRHGAGGFLYSGISFGFESFKIPE